MALFVARTGYTGEDGFEIIVPEAQTVAFWNALLAAGVKPAGLGARDTLRLEAGMNLYGQDMDDTVSPYEAALAWTVALDEGRDFIGRARSKRRKQSGVPRQMIGLVMDEKGVLRHGQKVLTGERRGRDPVRHVLADARQGDRVRARAGRRARASVRVDIRGKRSPRARREVPVRARRQGAGRHLIRPAVRRALDPAPPPFATLRATAPQTDAEHGAPR